MSKTALRVIAILLAAFAPARALAQPSIAAMSGEWAGTARITVDWTLRRQLDVHIAIREDGSVSGSIIHTESIARDAVRLPLNWTGGMLERDLVASGSHEPRRPNMVLTASRLVLRRVAAPPLPTSR